ncbi:MAG TPA: helix-turn-helix transcriptional regulator [Bacteriovoracaceae bacterium]|nr:helix-turn-helix transcriptional regulator [Bacteriovoracaceae bacterium]
MLKLFYDPDIDYLEVFFQKTPNYGDETETGIITFKNEKNDKIVGYGFHKPAKVILNSFILSPKIKIAVMCFLKRKKLGLSERELASRLNLSYRTYQRIEEGEISKIDDFLKISEYISDVDFSKIFKAS